VPQYLSHPLSSLVASYLLRFPVEDDTTRDSESLALICAWRLQIYICISCIRSTSAASATSIVVLAVIPGRSSNSSSDPGVVGGVSIMECGLYCLPASSIEGGTIRIVFVYAEGLIRSVAHLLIAHLTTSTKPGDQPMALSPMCPVPTFIVSSESGYKVTDGDLSLAMLLSLEHE
jgi:hypothetical protein